MKNLAFTISTLNDTINKINIAMQNKDYEFILNLIIIACSRINFTPKFDIWCVLRTFFVYLVSNYTNSYVKCSPTYKNDLKFIRGRLKSRQIRITTSEL